MVETGIPSSAPPSNSAFVPGNFVRISGLTNQIHYNDRTAVVESLCADGKLGLRVIGGALLKVSADKVAAEEDQSRTNQARFNGCICSPHCEQSFSLQIPAPHSHKRIVSFDLVVAGIIVLFRTKE
jgi:hypothetical protein